jgi:hypothetical protein
MGFERLPPEIIEEVFDFLRKNKRLLKVCSLICKAWLHPAYRRLFYDTRLFSSGLAAACDPRSESTAAPFIRCLHITYSSPREWNEIFPSLDGFHSVTSLSIPRLPWDEILPEIRLTISNRFFAIVRLELGLVITTSFSELAQIICMFHCLEKLILGRTVWYTSDKPSSLLRLPQHLRALELRGSDSTNILEWLSSSEEDLTLRDVCILSYWGHRHHVINTFLRDLGPSLESFRIRLKGALLSFVSLSIVIYGRHRFEQESIGPYVYITIHASVFFTSMSGAASKAILSLPRSCHKSFLCT